VTQRARTDADKQSRRSDILDAAGAVFDEVDVDEFTMGSVAATLDLAKGTLYRYVPTREALLLALTTDAYADWFDHVDAALAALGNVPSSCDTRSTVTTVTTVIVDSLLERPRLIRLMPLIASVLERNIPLDTAHEYKSFLVRRSEGTVAVLASRLGCTTERSMQFLVHLQALTTGLSHQAHPAPVVTEALADPALSGLHIDLRVELTHGVRSLLLAAVADDSPEPR
jgi:AcrR family transcriptional regulator